MNYSQKIADAFFQPFYLQRIEIARQLGRTHYAQLDIALLTFWFSVIDFYGGIYYIGIHNEKKTYDRRLPNGQNLKLAHGDSFKEFIHDFFPEPENELGEFIYSIFRSGIVHQLSPKKSSIVWEPHNPKLLWMVIDGSEPNQKANKVATLNISRMAELTFNSFIMFSDKIKMNTIPLCENIYIQLLDQPDGLEDGAAINAQFNKLSGALQSYLTEI